MFWIYLVFSSQMTIAYDSIGFENGGRILNSEGLRGYLKNGPQKEPLYSYTISLSMKLADVLHVDYKKVQTCFQIILLFLGQIFLYRILLLLKLNETITAISLLYYGLSPGLISCGFDLYSEIVTLQFILLSIFLMSKAWRFLLEEDLKFVILYAFLFAFTATLATFSKAVLLVLYPLFVLPFAVVLGHCLVTRKKRRGQCAVIFLIIFFTVFNSAVNGYKSLNRKYHGSYSFTDERGSTMFYTLALKRTAPLKQEFLSMALLMIPGENVCRSVYGQACYQWMYDGSADLGQQKRSELGSYHVPEDKIERTLVLSAVRQILSNPLQYSFFNFLEAIKMFFWESTKIGFVSYPQWLTSIHDNFLVKNALRLIMGLLTLFSVGYVAVYLLKNRREAHSERYQCLFFLFFFLVLFIGLYSLVMTVVRYSLPVTPLFIAVLAFTANERF